MIFNKMDNDDFVIKINVYFLLISLLILSGYIREIVKNFYQESYKEKKMTIMKYFQKKKKMHKTFFIKFLTLNFYNQMPFPIPNLI